MAPTLCASCQVARAVIIRPKNRQRLCKTCFIAVFEDEIHQTITNSRLFQPGERVAIGASGGKDSTVLASILKTLNERHQYGLDLVLLSIDEGIKGYRDDSLETVKRNAVQYELPLLVVGYDQLYGWTMDEVVSQIGKKGNCTYCGVFRRQALDRGAAQLRIQHVVTGHNADDIAETVLMNLLRGDLPRLARATSIVTAHDASAMKRSKPLKYAYEKEIVLYAHHKNLEYFTTECIYSPEAFRGTARALIKDLERIRPSAILDVVRSGEDMAKLAPDYVTPQILRTGNNEVDVTDKIEQLLVSDAQVNSPSLPVTNGTNKPEDAACQFNAKVDKATEPAAKPFTKIAKQEMGQCERCGYLTSQVLCKACVLLEALNKARPKTQIVC